MQIIEQLQALYARQETETLETWLVRVIRDFLNLHEVPCDKPLVSLGATSLSAVILLDLVKRETGAGLTIEHIMNGGTVASIAGAIRMQPPASSNG